MALRFFNTYSRELEQFEPADPAVHRMVPGAQTEAEQPYRDDQQQRVRRPEGEGRGDHGE